MWKSLLVILSVVVLALSYLPLRQQTSYVSSEQNHLVIDMHKTLSLMLNRTEPEKRFQLISESVIFDEVKDLTTFKPFSITAHTGQQSLKGDSLQASLTKLEMNLIDQVVLQQSADNKLPRQFHSEQLIIELKKHHLTSPGAIRMIDEQQQIEADSLIGNYEEGWYEFTQHVKTQWQ
jgi:LPS export ABC transporter protein LptC